MAITLSEPLTQLLDNPSSYTYVSPLVDSTPRVYKSLEDLSWVSYATQPP